MRPSFERHASTGAVVTSLRALPLISQSVITHQSDAVMVEVAS